MAIYGKIVKFEIVTLRSNLDCNDDPVSISYIKQKHETAEANGRYVIKFHVADPRHGRGNLTMVSVFIPKGIIDNGLIETGTNISCSDTSCHFEIIGVDDWFDRASNGVTQIHDKRFKVSND